ncbi:MAG: endolytic transglycosylase MltG [Eubacteriales bacterium]|nr:endolytic transglycosylase MltG [Eubacteriales bacterium]
MREKENIYARILGFCFHILLDVMFVFFILEGYTYSYNLAYRLFGDLPATVMSTQTMRVTIDEGSSAKQVADELKLKGVIDDSYVFMARVYLGKYSNRIVSGTYILGPGMSPDQICRTICGIRSEEAS